MSKLKVGAFKGTLSAGKLHGQSVKQTTAGVTRGMPEYGAKGRSKLPARFKAPWAQNAGPVSKSADASGTNLGSLKGFEALRQLVSNAKHQLIAVRAPTATSVKGLGAIPFVGPSSQWPRANDVSFFVHKAKPQGFVRVTTEKKAEWLKIELTADQAAQVRKR